MAHKCLPVKITTPDRFVLDGLLFGEAGAKRGYIFVHGLTSSIFALQTVLNPLIDSKTMVLHFNNRGHNVIARNRKMDSRRKKGTATKMGGGAYETFTDCTYDIQGAVDLLKQEGAKEIYLVGHSTGCQKSVYYLSRRTADKTVKGAILLCPMSDYAWNAKYADKTRLDETVVLATQMVKEGYSNELLPLNVCPDIYSAQRFLSLYTQDSSEEIFCYSQPNKQPRALQKVKAPLLIVLAEKDEYRDRSIKKIAAWFEKSLKQRPAQIEIVKNAGHGLKDYERSVTKLIAEFTK